MQVEMQDGAFMDGRSGGLEYNKGDVTHGTKSVCDSQVECAQRLFAVLAVNPLD